MTRIRVMPLPTSMGSRRPYKLVTVSRYPEKASNMVRRLAEVLDDRFMVIHAANCERTWSSVPPSVVSRLTTIDLEEINFRVRDLQPDMLVCTPLLFRTLARTTTCAGETDNRQVWSSSWTPEQVDFIRAVTKRLKADVDMYGLPEDSPSDLSVDALLLRLKADSRLSDVQ